MIGVPIRDPKTPPLEMVNDPPAISSSAKDPFASSTKRQAIKLTGAAGGETRDTQGLVYGSCSSQGELRLDQGRFLRCACGDLALSGYKRVSTVTNECRRLQTVVGSDDTSPPRKGFTFEHYSMIRAFLMRPKNRPASSSCSHRRGSVAPNNQPQEATTPQTIVGGTP